MPSPRSPAPDTVMALVDAVVALLSGTSLSMEISAEWTDDALLDLKDATAKPVVWAIDFTENMLPAYASYRHDLPYRRAGNPRGPAIPICRGR